MIRRLFFLVLALSLILISCLFTLDYLGFIAVGPFLVKQVSAIPGLGAVVTTYKSGLDAENKLAALETAMQQREAELARKQEELARAQAELAKAEVALQAEQRELQRIRTQLAEQQTPQTDAAIEQAAKWAQVYAEMRPVSAAASLSELDDQMVLAILTRMEEYKAAAILAELKPSRVAKIVSQGRR